MLNCTKRLLWLIIGESMRSLTTTRCRVVSFAIASLFAANHLLAQQPNRPPAGSSAPTAAKAAPASADAAEKAKILASEPWKQVISEYQKWLSSQAIYTPDDVKRINTKLAAEIQAM